MMSVAYFHEDDYCQIELVCDDNLEWCLEETRRIDEFSNAHKAGLGWTSMYERPPAPIPLRERAISIGSIAQSVATFLPVFDLVKIGYPATAEDALHTRAFGIESSVNLFAELADETVSAMWLTLQPRDGEEVRTATAALTSLRDWRLLLVDWGWLRVIPLDDEEAVRNYLEERRLVFAGFFDEFRTEHEQVLPAAGPARSWIERLRRWFRSER